MKQHNRPSDFVKLQQKIIDQELATMPAKEVNEILGTMTYDEANELLGWLCQIRAGRIYHDLTASQRSEISPPGGSLHPADS